MAKAQFGEIILIPKDQGGGAIQYVHIPEKGEFILVTGRGPDHYLPLPAVYEALEDSWVYETKERSKRMFNARK